jgi:hypothetical protein
MLAHILSESYMRRCLSEWANQIVPSSFLLNPHALSGELRDRFLARLYEHRCDLQGMRSSKDPRVERLALPREEFTLRSQVLLLLGLAFFLLGNLEVLPE